MAVNEQTNKNVKGRQPTPQRRERQDGYLVGIIERKFFLRDGLRGAIQALLLSLMITVALVFIVAYLSYALATVKPEYFAVDDQGRMTPIIPVSEPFMKDGQLLNWAASAATQLYNFDHLKYKQQLPLLKDKFTDKGWANFKNAFEAAGITDKIERDRDIVSATPIAPPVIDNSGVLSNGSYAWLVLLPMRVTYQGQSNIISQDLLITLVIQRVSTALYKDGVAISSYVEGKYVP